MALEKPNRRTFLKQATFAGCSIAAHPLLTPITMASVPGDARLIVIILRGGMDGLDVLQPIGDPLYHGYRTRLKSPSQPLTDFYALNDTLKELRPLWDTEELGFVQAVATPYRDKRSHFDGQDLLEAGTGVDVAVNAIRDGWLNRLLQTQSGVTGETAYAIGGSEMLILSGSAPSATWSPNTKMRLNPQARLLLERIYMHDLLFHEAATEAIDLTNSMSAGGTQKPSNKYENKLARFAAERLNQETRIASFSLNGWDTHRNQVYPLSVALKRLNSSILTLKAGLGDNWQHTAVLAMTEFGRSARENGNVGTDHGTGGMMFVAGGAVRGGKVFGGWPGLSESALYDRRDLMPTADVRSYAAWAMRDLFGIELNDLERKVFPGLELAKNPGIIR